LSASAGWRASGAMPEAWSDWRAVFPPCLDKPLSDDFLSPLIVMGIFLSEFSQLCTLSLCLHWKKEKNCLDRPLSLL
jgi:hypothetical protein